MNKLQKLFDKWQAQAQHELSRLRRNDPTLTHVNFVRHNGAKVSEVADALRCNTHLESLFLYCRNLYCRDGVAAAIADIIRVNRSLKALWIEKGGIDDGGAAAIAAALSDNNTLTHLYLVVNRIGAIGAKAIAAALSKRNESTPLVHLDLDRNEIGDDGGRAMAAMLRSNTSITYLNLRNCDIGDDGAKAIAAALVANDTIKELHLSGNRIGDDGAKAIAAAYLLRLRFCYIDLDGNSDIGEEGRSAFDLYRRLYFNGDGVVATNVPAAVALIEQLLPATNFISLSAIVATNAAALRSAHPPKPGRLAILDTAQRLIIDRVLAQTRLIPDAAMPLALEKIGGGGDDDKNAIGHKSDTGINALFEVCIDKPHLFKDANMDEGMDGQRQGQGQGEEEETTQKTPQGNTSDTSLRVPAQDMKKRSGKCRYRQMDITNSFGKKITMV